MLEQTSYGQWLGSTIGEYRLTRLQSTSPLGPLFTADSVQSSSTFLLRLLTVPPAQTSEAMGIYQGYLERQAGHIITLRHPYMLPLVNYGIYQGQPYFVWPYTSMRSLTTRVSQSGVLDVVTAGRYLDQIAAALEYAHQHATFHRNLSLDCIYLQMDGQIAVADFGVRRLYELLTPGNQAGFFSGSQEALAPEQLTGGQIGPFTDVYALGGVTYRLLTGHPVFNGESFRAIAEQHLQAPPPSLTRARPGLPAALDRVLAGALAKDPAQRIQHPGVFADAYQEVVAPANSLRVPFDAPGGLASASPSQQPPLQRAGGGTPRAPAGRTGASSGPAVASSRGWRQFFARGWGFFLAVLVLVPLVSFGVFFFANNRQSPTNALSGSLLFVDSASPPDGSNDGMRISVRGLAAPVAGSRYEVWLVNQKTEQIIALGQLVAGQNQTYQLVYIPGGTNGTPAANVLARGNMIEITEERSNVVAPAGHILLSVTFPPQAFTHIGHLLLSFPTTPGKIGLLVGVLRQTDAINTQASALDTAARAGQTDLVRCLAQSIVDISEGTHGAHYQPLDSACKALGVTEAGDGFGLLSPTSAANGNGYPAESTATGYIKNAADHASLATGTPDATEALRQHAATVQTDLAAVTKSVAAADTAALKLLTSPTDMAAVAALVAASGAAYHGSGGDRAGSAVAAYQQGQLMATLSLTQAAS
jgi:eukaryotic-like serine/threonine-protein kinase